MSEIYAVPKLLTSNNTLWRAGGIFQRQKFLVGVNGLAFASQSWFYAGRYAATLRRFLSCRTGLNDEEISHKTTTLNEKCFVGSMLGERKGRSRKTIDAFIMCATNQTFYSVPSGKVYCCHGAIMAFKAMTLSQDPIF